MGYPTDQSWSDLKMESVRRETKVGILPKAAGSSPAGGSHTTHSNHPDF